MICNSEVNALNYDSDGHVRSLSILGKFGKDVECDAVVLCSGAATSWLLYNTLGTFAPLVPLRGITFDFKTTMENQGKHMIFEDEGLITTQIQDGIWRVSGYGDLAGFDKNYDKRRVFNLVRLVAKVFDSKEPGQTLNLNTYLRTCTPDDVPVVGPLRHFPNVFINSGHGGRSAAVSIGSSKLCSEII